MMTSTMLSKVADYLVEATERDIKAEDVTLETSLQDELDLDSMQSVTMIMELEDEYSISIDNDELTELKTVGDLVKKIEIKLESLEKASSKDP